MTTRDLNPRRSLEAAADLGRRCGLGVRETDFRDLDGTVVVNLTAAGEWIEVHFREHPATGYLRFDRGYVHLDHGEADRLHTWRATRGVVESTGREMRRIGAGPPDADAPGGVA